MKKYQFLNKSVFIALIIPLLFSCKFKQASPDQLNTKNSISNPVVVEDHDTLLLDLTHQVLSIIKNKDYTLFAEFIHPKLGLRFSPYANIDTLHHVKFSRDQFLNAVKDNKPLLWGYYDGKGDPILLTVENYFAGFVYNYDFSNASQVSVNEVLGKGNSENNLKAVYPVSDFTESYFPGVDKKAEGKDWSSLRLVFAKNLDKYYLIGIVHDQWTI